MLSIINKLEVWFYQQSVQKYFVYIGFVGVFIAIFALNYFFPIYADDMLYSVVKFQDSVNLGENLKEIGEFMYYYYFNWGGRVVGIGSVHLLLLFNTLGLDIINTLIFIVLLWITYLIAKQEKEADFFLFLFLAVSIFYFTPSFLSSTIWITGSGVFLITTTFTFLFVYPYYKLANSKKYNDSTFRIIAFFFFGILASWSNENTGPTLFLLVLSLLIIIYFRQERLLPFWALSGLLGVIIGCSLMILAPGNGVRAEAEGYQGLFSSLSKISERLPYIYGSYRHFMLRPIILFFVCLFLHHFFAKNEETKKDIALYAIVFFAIANISIWLTVLAPSFPPRAFFSITVLTLVSIAILYANIDFKNMLPKVLNFGLIASLLFFASIDYMTYLKGTYFLHREIDKREAIISEHIKEGKTSVTFEKIHMDYRFEYTDFANYYQDYYGIKTNFVDKLEDN